jgi:hypothetical protein
LLAAGDKDNKPKKRWIISFNSLTANRDSPKNDGHELDVEGNDDDGQRWNRDPITLQHTV